LQLKSSIDGWQQTIAEKVIMKATVGGFCRRARRLVNRWSAARKS
jgi:hypothetical protein